MHINETIDDIARIRKSSRELVREFGFFQSKYSDTEATHGESHALIELNRLGQLEVGELARILNMEKSGASKLLGHMVKIKWATFRTLGDARKKLFTLTRLGQSQVNEIERLANKRMSAALAELDDKSASDIEKALTQLAAALKSSRARSTYVIRRCEPKDNKHIASIIRRALKDFGFAGPGTVATDATLDYLSSFNGERKCYFVAERNGKILGGAGVLPMAGESKEICELVRMFLHPDARSSGIAQLLLDVALNDALRFGYSTCYLETTEEMKSAQRLYLKNGFRYVKERRGNTGHFACKVLMEKKLR